MFSSFLQTSVSSQADRILLLKLQKDTPKGNKTPKLFSFQKPREMALFLAAESVSQELLKQCDLDFKGLLPPLSTSSQDLIQSFPCKTCLHLYT